MNITLRLSASYDAVYLINGIFVEKGVATVSADDVLYVTILPLCAAFLPYTVRLTNGAVSGNESLCFAVTDENGNVNVFFQPRYNYVYTPSNKFTPPVSTITHFFRAVKKGNYSAARAYLTANLSNEVTDDTLAQFFSGYDDIVEGDNGNGFLVGDKTAHLTYSLVADKIDDINIE